jgi:putative component of toxin-antitoxin plasmid stabilization module
MFSASMLSRTGQGYRVYHPVRDETLVELNGC